MQIPAYIKKIGSGLSLLITAVWGLQEFGILPSPIPALEVSKQLANYVALLAMIAFGAASLWVGYEIPFWRTKKARPQSKGIGFIVEQHQLYDRIGKDLWKIRRALDEANRPTDILFPSWNETVDFDKRDALIEFEDIQKATERFSTALNRRNRRRKELLEHGWNFETTSASLDEEFKRANEACIEAYHGIEGLAIQETIVPPTPPPQALPSGGTVAELPQLYGQIHNVMRGLMTNPEKPSEQLASFFLFLYLTNRSRTPAHIEDYALYVGTDGAFERVKILEGVSEGGNFNFEYQGRMLEIPDLKKRLLNTEKRTVEFNIPVYGFLLFAGSIKYYKADIQRYKLTCTDALGSTYEIIANPATDFKGLGFLVDSFGVKGFHRPKI